MTLLKFEDPATPSAQSFRFAGQVHQEPVNKTSTADQRENTQKGTPERNDTGNPPSNVAKEATLLERIAELESALEASEKSNGQVQAAAYEEGKQDGVAAAAKLADESVDLLREAIAQQQAELASYLAEQHRTGIEIARAVIRKILGDQSQLTDHVLQTAAIWKQELRTSSIQRLTVSSRDFPTETELAKLKNGFEQIEICADTELDRGACVFDLQLGKLDASIACQADNADTMLDDLCRHGPSQ